MKVKELIINYPNHRIVYMGYPNCAPFTQLPEEVQGLYGNKLKKALDKLDVKGYKVTNHHFTDINVTHLVFGGKKRPNKTYDGILEIYLKGEK